MGLFSHSDKSKNEGSVDYKRLRNDLMDEYGAQMVSFSGARGYSDMCDAQKASEEELLNMARREGFNIDKYKR